MSTTTQRCITGLILLLTICLVGVSTSRAADEWGTLKGRFVIDGKAPAPAKLTVTKDVNVCGQHPLVDESLVVDDKGGVANVFVWVRGPKGFKINPDYEKTAKEKKSIDNDKCRFEPHALIIRTTQPLEVKNSDSVPHNTNIAQGANSAPNQIIPPNSSENVSMPLAENLPLAVTCNIHPWMKGWLLVRPDPYFAVSDKDGNFEIKNLPAGTELEFQVWQEKTGYVQKAKVNGKDAGWTRGRFKTTIKPGDNNLGDIKLDAAQFNK